jgi:SAM-dependent methyltransferase
VAGTDEQEIDRIRGEFRRRREQIGGDFYSLHRPANLFLRQCYERDLVRTLTVAGQMPLSGKRLLDVGCGSGGWLATFEQLGVARQDLAGLELDPADVEAVRARFSGADVRVGDGLEIPWADAAFDLVFQSTVFTSILDPAVRARLAREMLRVLRPGGAVVWLDFRYDNPRNRNVVGLGLREIRELFPGRAVHARTTALVPPLARAVVPWSWSLGALLERVPPLRSHLVAVISA